MTKTVKANLFYDDDNLVGRLVYIDDLTPHQIRQALDRGARWQEGDEWLFVSNKR